MRIRWWRGLSTAALYALAAFGTPALADEDGSSAERLAIGPAAYAMPRFPGSDRSRTIYFPFVDAEYDNRVYMSASDLIGVYAYKTQVVQTGVAVEWGPTRRQARDDSRLRGLPDVKETARAKLFASRTVYIVTLEENFASDMLGRGQGSLSQTNLWLTAPLSATLSVNVGPGVTWADHAYMQSFYTVDASAAAQNSELRAYYARAGLVDLRLNGLAEWQLRKHYRLGLLACAAHLRGDASASPLALQRSQRTLMGWVAYQFR